MFSKSGMVLAVVLASLPASAAEWYVAPDGKQTNAGTKESPWDVLPVIMGQQKVAPGDTVWLRGGSYKPRKFEEGLPVQLKGTAEKPVIVRQYPGERAAFNPDYFGMHVRSSHLQLRDFEITMPDINRKESSTGFNLYEGTNVKVINLVVHDVNACGIQMWDKSMDAEMYGCIDYYNGLNSPQRPAGHGAYMQNIKGIKTVAENVVFDNAFEGLQIYGGGGANVVGFRIDGNVVFNNGWNEFQQSIIVAGGATRKDMQVTNNLTYIGTASGGATFGQWTAGEDLLMKDNVFAGGYVTLNCSFQSGPVVCTGNRIVTDPKALSTVWLYIMKGHSKDKYTWDKNEYWGAAQYGWAYSPAYTAENEGRQYHNWAGWQKNVGFDADGKFDANPPKGLWTYVRPNKYETGRANIAIYNWDKKDKVDVDLSKSGLKEGDAFEVRDAQNFFGKPVVEGKYDGKPVSIPMTGLTKARAIGVVVSPHSAPLFGAFVVMKAGNIK
jgi:hypothetical protein